MDRHPNNKLRGTEAIYLSVAEANFETGEYIHCPILLTAKFPASLTVQLSSLNLCLCTKEKILLFLPLRKILAVVCPICLVSWYKYVLTLHVREYLHTEIGNMQACLHRTVPLEQAIPAPPAPLTAHYQTVVVERKPGHISKPCPITPGGKQ